MFFEFCMTELLQRKRGTYTKSKIKNWKDILDLLEFFNDPVSQTDEQTLKEIFKVCMKKRDWKIPEEFNLKQQFELLEYRNFFHTLYNRLDKKACINEIEGIRWHKITSPQYTMISIKELFTPSKIYSPFWKK